MKIPYRNKLELKKVDINKLRPQNSYGHLLEKRTHSITDKQKETNLLRKSIKTNLRECPSCGSIKKTLLFKKDGFPISECNSCRLVYVSEVLDAEHYIETYQQEEFQEIMAKLGHTSHEYRVERFGNERIEKITSYLEKDGPVRHLDIGCSTGFVVEAATNYGWLSDGVELNPAAVQFARNRGLRVNQKSLEDHNVEYLYDVITLYDVLEHLINPKQIINLVKTKLNKSGLVHIYVPNLNCMSYKLTGKDAHFIWPSHHLTYFTPETISNFLKENGFHILDIETDGLDFVDYIWQIENNFPEYDTNLINKIKDDLQAVTNAALWGKNLRIIARSENNDYK